MKLTTRTHEGYTAQHHVDLGEHDRWLVDERCCISDPASTACHAQCNAQRDQAEA
jgi:hypothetical protein